MVVGTVEVVGVEVGMGIDPDGSATPRDGRWSVKGRRRERAGRPSVRRARSTTDERGGALGVRSP